MTIADEALSGRVMSALVQDKRIGGQAIAVRAAGGEVFLKGIVDSEDLKNLAGLVARGIAGVRSINIEELRVREASE